MNAISTESITLRTLMTPERWMEIGRIVVVAFITLLYWQG